MPKALMKPPSPLCTLPSLYLIDTCSPCQTLPESHLALAHMAPKPEPVLPAAHITHIPARGNATFHSFSLPFLSVSNPPLRLTTPAKLVWRRLEQREQREALTRVSGVEWTLLVSEGKALFKAIKLTPQPSNPAPTYPPHSFSWKVWMDTRLLRAKVN